MPATILTNARVFDGTSIRADRSVVLEDGLIIDVVAGRAGASETQDLGGALLAPGFIDLQVNGGGGVLFNDGTQRRDCSPHSAPRTASSARPGFPADAHKREPPNNDGSHRGKRNRDLGKVRPACWASTSKVHFSIPPARVPMMAAVLRRPEPTDIKLLTLPRSGKTLVTLGARDGRRRRSSST